MEAETSLVVAVDFQEKLLPIIDSADKLIVNATTLLSGSGLFHVPIIATEQYPKGLGSTVEAIRQSMPEEVELISKVTYSCCDEPQFIEKLTAYSNAKQIVLIGIETPICILQTAIDLADRGYTVYLPEDACSGQIRADHITALRQLEQNECVVTCVESILYRWCRSAEHEQFKTLSRLVRDRRQKISEIEKGQFQGPEFDN
ncbi:MAG: isochorismatase family protein [Fibrobacter sp.]|nr:isochorismatase family protein [Fibrobacter sp.]